MLFCCKNAENGMSQNAGQLPERRLCPLSGISHSFSAYITCAMKLPIFSAALYCICRVTWV